MPAAADQSDTLRQFQLVAFPERDHRVQPGDKLPVHRVQVDRDAVERMAPFHNGRQKVRMGAGNPCQSAKRLHDGDRGLIQEADAVPQDVASRGAQDQRPLPDREGGKGADPHQPLLQPSERVEVGLAHDRQRGPGLAGRIHVLPVILTDQAPCRSRLRVRVLAAAGGAYEGRHLVLSVAATLTREPRLSAAPHNIKRPDAPLPPLSPVWPQSANSVSIFAGSTSSIRAGCHAGLRSLSTTIARTPSAKSG